MFPRGYRYRAPARSQRITVAKLRSAGFHAAKHSENDTGREEPYVIAVASLLTIVVAILIIARIATVALVATGLPYDVARFQARSALTGVGFSTAESEQVVGHPLRRRIVMVLMLVGNAGFVTIVASVMLSFSSNPSTTDVLIRMAIAVGGLTALGFITRSRFFEVRFTQLMARLVDRFSDLDLRDFHHLMQLTNDFAITELQVREGDWLAGRNLMELELPDEGVLVLAVQRADGDFIGAPRGMTQVHPNDTLVLYGRSAVLSDLDRRPAGQGDAAHAEAVAEQQEFLAEGHD